MIAVKQPIVGQVIRQVGNKVIVRCGDRVDVYNLDWYRVVPAE